MQTLSNWAHKLKATPKVHWQFSGVEFLYRFAWAASGFLTVFLQNKGLSASQVGLIGALNSAVAIIAAPIWGVVSDKMRSVRRVLLLCSIVGSVLWTFVPLAYGQPQPGMLPFGLLLVPLSCFFRNPCMSLLDSWVVQSVNRHKLNYGAVRFWGSIGYAVMNIVLSLLMPYIGVETTFYACTIAFVPVVALSLTIRDDATKVKAVPLKEMQIGRLFKSFPFVAYIVYYLVLQMPVTINYTFLPYLMKEVSVNTDLFGLFSAGRALLEIPSLLIMVKLRKQLRMPTILMLATALFMLETFAYTFIQGAVPLLAMQMLHGVASGLFIGTASNYIFSLAPEGLKATAQTVAGSVNAVAGILGSLLGGRLFDLLGVRRFYLVAGLVILVAGLFFLLTNLWHSRQRTKSI